jgi:hypothetical protein
MTIRNDSALFLWGFMAIWWGMSWTLAGAALAFFWCGGAAGAAWAFSHARLRLEIASDGCAQLECARLFRRRRETLSPGMVARVTVEETTDSDGDAYFLCQLRLADGRHFAVAEGHDRPSMEACASRLRCALRLG